MDESLEELKRIASRYHRRRERFIMDRALLYVAVREAAKQGHTRRAIAEVAGLSFQRVHQILEGSAD